MRVGLLIGTLLLTGCTSATSAPPPEAMTGAPAQKVTVLASPTGVQMGIDAARAVWKKSVFAVVAPVSNAAAGDEAAAQAKALKAPMFLVDPSDPAPVTAELNRLGATTVLAIGDLAGAAFDGVTVVTQAQDLPAQTAAEPLQGLATFTTASGTVDTTAAVATLEAAGATQIALASPDPRVTSADVQAVAAEKPTHVIALGKQFGRPKALDTAVATAATGVELPGGGQTIFDNKRYVALYGSPETSVLGVLGEQDPAASVARAKQVAAPYQAFTQETVVPAFEVISTIADAPPGPDGDYSRPTPHSKIKPLIDAAKKSGTYVVLDLQPGRTDFLTQAKQLEPLLKEPHVGLALDPEWRLKPGQKHLQQIGSVEAAEINTVIDWLSDLTAKNKLPQKMLLLHQFRLSMIKNRETLDTSRPEVAMVIQMDGDGTPGQKQDTWAALQVGAPDAIKFGWKNFYDEDEPTPSPEYTFTEVSPQPFWVSYQ